MYEKELNAVEVKAKAKECGADLVGIAPMNRWEGWRQWEIDHSKPYEIPADTLREYEGNIESHDAYTNYNIKSNYGTKAAAGLVQDNSSSGGVA